MRSKKTNARYGALAGSTLLLVGLNGCGVGGQGPGGPAAGVDAYASELGADCRAACLDDLRAVVEACIAEEVSRDECRDRLEETRDGCIEECAAPRPGDEGGERPARGDDERPARGDDGERPARGDGERPARDEDGHGGRHERQPRPGAQCAHEAHAQHRACVDGGGEPEACAQDARAAQRQCREAHADDHRRGPARGCLAECARGVRAEVIACVEDGGERDACVDAGRGAFDACAETECFDDEEAPADDAPPAERGERGDREGRRPPPPPEGDDEDAA